MDASEKVFRKIKSDLALKGITFAGIGRQVGANRQQIWQVARGLEKTKRIREAIAAAIGRDPWASAN